VLATTRNRRSRTIASRKSRPAPVDFNQPPPRKVICPIIDAHTHVGSPAEAAKLVESARLYDIERILGITSLNNSIALDAEFPGCFDYALSLDYRHKDEPQKFQRDNVRLIETAARRDFKVVKFWYKPTFNADQQMKLDDARLTAVFDRMGELGLTGLTHIADPDCWFDTAYGDVERFGTKADQYAQLENMLERHPNTNMIGAHMAGHPEDLEHLSQLLETYPNLYLDNSATKWVSREVSLNPEGAREFFIRYADRILFGTDLVVRGGWPVEMYSSRYWIHRVMWESSTVCDLPIDDPDNPGKPTLVGIDLPEDALRKLYYQNAVRLLGIILDT